MSENGNKKHSETEDAIGNTIYKSAKGVVKVLNRGVIGLILGGIGLLILIIAFC